MTFRSVRKLCALLDALATETDAPHIAVATGGAFSWIDVWRKDAARDEIGAAAPMQHGEDEVPYADAGTTVTR